MQRKRWKQVLTGEKTKHVESKVQSREVPAVRWEHHHNVRSHRLRRDRKKRATQKQQREEEDDGSCQKTTAAKPEKQA